MQNYTITMTFKVKAESRKDASKKVRTTLRQMSNLTSAENWLGAPYKTTHAIVKAALQGEVNSFEA